MAEIAAKQSRAEQLREELVTLRVQHTADMSAASEAAHEVRLDAEIAELENQVAIERLKRENGGSTIDAMEVMAAAAEAEKKAAEAAAKSAGSSPEDKVQEESQADEKDEKKSDEAPVVGLNLAGGNQ